ncbi:baseplate wedge subunit [Sinorhizobium phage phiM19]|nr:baseplate wedge subunit [Sinorhizobium phage phiM19]
MDNDRLSFQEISHLIENQFPAIYREEGQIFVAFVKAYYEWLETTDKNSYSTGRQMLQASDIDTTLDQFIDHFKSTYLDGFPYSSHVDTRFLIKHIMDFYRTRGTKQSTELLMKLLFGEEVEVYYPGDDVLKPSASVWKKPEYIEVSVSDRTKNFVDKKITGSVSGATAFVDSVVRKRIAGKLIDVIYISSVKGKFITGDLIMDDGDTNEAPVAIGSLTTFEVTSGGRNNKIGDLFDVISPAGLHGKVRVTGVEDATGRVDFKLVEGGNGYTTDENTEVLVSNTVLYIENSGLKYMDLDHIYQPVETVDVLAAGTLNASAVPGDVIFGVDSSNNLIAEGRVISVTDSSSSNSTLTILASNGTFLDQLLLTTDTPATGMVVGEGIDEEGKAVIDISSSAGTINVGHLVEQFEYLSGSNNLIIGYSSGIVESVVGSALTVNSYFGEIKVGAILVNNSFNASVSAVAPITSPASAIITNVVGSNVSVRAVEGVFDAGLKVRTKRSRITKNLASTSSQGASDVILDKNDATGVIDGTANTWVTGIVIGQNTSSIGVVGSNNFIVSNTFPTYVYTDRSRLLSPPKDANGNVIIVKSAIVSKSTGHSATFKIGSIANEQTVTVSTDFVAGVNVAGTPYFEIRLDGLNSGANRVDGFTINNGGTGYSNGSIITLSGGGYGGAEVYQKGHGVITTDGSGTITSIAFEPGWGYFEYPTVVLPATSGTTADVDVLLRLAYGFPKSYSGGADTILADMFDSETMTIGTITSLTAINPGVMYNADPFVRVYNKNIAAYDRGNFILDLSNISGSFQEGETINQVVDGITFKKGIVISYNPTTTRMRVQRELFETDFNDGVPIVGGSVTASTALISSVTPVDEYIFGDNAQVPGTVIAANGVVTGVEVINSGYGYEEGEADLTSETNPFAVSGTIHLGKHGIGEGFWQTTTSHLNSEKKIHDNKYYQEFSYDIISSMSLSRYADILKSITHVSGTQMFGSVAKITRGETASKMTAEIEIITI